MSYAKAMLIGAIGGVVAFGFYIWGNKSNQMF